MIIALFTVAVMARAIVLVFDEISKAPSGYQDKMGFHFGIHPECAAPAADESMHAVPDFVALRDQCSVPFEGEPAGPTIRAQIPWFIRNVGIAALFVVLMVSLPKEDKILEMRTSRSEFAAASIPPLPQPESAPNNRQEETIARIRSEPSRLIQTFCQRSTRAE